MANGKRQQQRHKQQRQWLMKSLKCMEIANRMCVCLCASEAAAAAGMRPKCRKWHLKGLGRGAGRRDPIRGGIKAK